MNKNKGIIGLGLIIAIVLGIAVVGGGAYYLGKNFSDISSSIPDKDCGFGGEKCINKNKNLQQEDQNQAVDENKKVSITVLTPNGGEKFGLNQKTEVKWTSVGGDTVDIYLKNSDGNLCLIKTLPSSSNSWNFAPYNYKCLGSEKIISAGDYKFSLYLYKNNEMRPEPGTAFGSNDNSYIMDSSDNLFTINSTTKTNTEIAQLKKFIREKYSFYAPKEWVESSVILSGNKKGCELYNISYGGDGHKIGGEIGIYLNTCFNSSNPPSGPIKESTEKDGYYIVSIYDKDSGTTPAEELKTKEVYKKVLETFTLNK